MQQEKQVTLTYVRGGAQFSVVFGASGHQPDSSYNLVLKFDHKLFMNSLQELLDLN